MAQKKFDLAKHLGKKLEGQRKESPIPGRFGGDATKLADRRELRKRDAAAGLVPFACKLPADLVLQLKEHALGEPGGMNSMLEAMLRGALDQTSG